MRIVNTRWLGQYLSALLLLGSTAMSAQAEMVSITGGSLSITYDGSVFANNANIQSGIGADPTQDFMRFGRWWAPAETIGAGPAYTPKGPAAFRPLPGTGPAPRTPNFRDNRATLDPLYPVTSPTLNYGVNGSGTVANSEGRNRQSTTLAFDTSDPLGTMSGTVETNGVAAWWFANDAIVDMGAAWVSWGDLELRFDATRIADGYSGWIFANQLGGTGDIFDTKNITLNAGSSGISISGDLYGSPADGTWEGYTGMNAGIQVGSFNFNGVTAVPEASSLVLLGCSAAGGFVVYRRRRGNA